MKNDYNINVINRAIEPKLRELLNKFPAVFITGPRQSGKTTLCRKTFPDFKYVSFEDMDVRSRVRMDIRSFLEEIFRYPGVILDEIQRVPDILSYLQTPIDNRQTPPIILTGSQQFELSAKISQTLAGRVAVINLFPFSYGELCGRPAFNPGDLFNRGPVQADNSDIYECLFTGMYPPIYDRKINPRDWLNGYVRTYIERDVREIINVGDLEVFERFLMLCAGRSGQILQVTSLSSDCGISHTTARRWLSILETSGIIYLLRPYFKNFSKRLVKSPKLYFIDTGLMCFLLGIRSKDDISRYPLYGAIFETYVVSEFIKMFVNIGEKPPLYFWRNSKGNEVDIVINMGQYDIPVEIKASKTITKDCYKGLDYYLELSESKRGLLVYGGDNLSTQANTVLLPWRFIS